MKRPSGINFVIGLGIIFAVVAVTLCWTVWFAAPEFLQARGLDAPDYLIYVHFEQAFLLADDWLALAAFIGVIRLWKMRDWGYLFMLLAGNAAIFLGLMDLLYDLQHGMFVPLTPEAAIELAIVILLFSLGPLMIVIFYGSTEGNSLAEPRYKTPCAPVRIHQKAQNSRLAVFRTTNQPAQVERMKDEP
ncbi:MAG: hypothetical protein AB1345_01115 [Chloroflexota bacterium]